MLYLVRIFRTSSLGDSISSNPERTAPRRRGEEPGYTEALQWRAGNLSIKISLLIKENQITQVKELSTFPCMGNGRVWAHWSPHSVGISAILAEMSSPGLTTGSGCNLAIRSQVFFSFPSALRLTLEGWNCWRLLHPCLLIWQELFPFLKVSV